MKNLIGVIVFFLVLSLGFSVVAGEKPRKIRTTRQVFSLGAEKKPVIAKNGKFSARGFKRANKIDVVGRRVK